MGVNKLYSSVDVKKYFYLVLPPPFLPPCFSSSLERSTPAPRKAGRQVSEARKEKQGRSAPWSVAAVLLEAKQALFIMRRGWFFFFY